MSRRTPDGGGASTADVSRALAGAAPQPYWLDDPGRPAALPSLREDVRCDLAVVGGGYSGLWTALLAKERDPGRDVVLLEGARIGWAASGRNGGFCAASLTHGLPNGVERFPNELRTLNRLGAQNLDAIEATVRDYRIACDWERTGELNVATAAWQAEELRAFADLAAEHGEPVEFLDAASVRAQVNSPTFLAGTWDRDGCALVHPAKLAWGLREACLARGVRIFERSPIVALEKSANGPSLLTRQGKWVVADHVALATNAFPSLLKRVRPYIVPVYDYVLMSEPLSAAQLAETGWNERQGVGDSGNQFHYYRLTADNRILWGGYDAVYHYRGRIAAELEQRPETFAKLARHFFQTFPHLEGLRFTHSWGGVIDTCTRFCAFFGTAHGGRVAYAAGYTGLGVAATRFGANVMLDLLGGRATELTELEMVRTKPLPFPPEPFKALGVNLTRWSLDRADRHEGRRNLWLRALDRAGLGFDS
ncbi:FAD-dependent oxidoreductase [Actinocrinis puniceicyclus]|uniref:FAD-dependent oxidoreductase n=1 Tax=Actinocrinis puniceicyclus TaxID=977794 RepID=A0A8J7WK78_9ACTN|nr:FAD-dependent oxidoreductase [Actinocrinis puniceicyclus]MBS2962853.1 FAD-dependent oxidoreductase [Actinocrinis puniceicyclus]